jgi:hypothetical protein
VSEDKSKADERDDTEEREDDQPEVEAHSMRARSLDDESGMRAKRPTTHEPGMRAKRPHTH